MRVGHAEALRRYDAGPSYVETALDMHRMALMWCDLVSESTRRFLTRWRSCTRSPSPRRALGLPHQLMASLIVSATSVLEGPNNGGGEGWQLVDRITGGEV